MVSVAFSPRSVPTGRLLCGADNGDSPMRSEELKGMCNKQGFLKREKERESEEKHINVHKSSKASHCYFHLVARERP